MSAKVSLGFWICSLIVYSSVMGKPQDPDINSSTQRIDIPSTTTAKSVSTTTANSNKNFSEITNSSRSIPKIDKENDSSEPGRTTEKVVVTIPTKDKLPITTTTQKSLTSTELPGNVRGHAIVTKSPLKADKPLTTRPTAEESTGLKESNRKIPLQKELGVLPGFVEDLANVSKEQENPTFRLKEPGFGTPKPKPQVTTPAFSDEDKRIRGLWGGNCLAKHWDSCKHVVRWGGDYFVKDKENPNKQKIKNHSIDCTGKAEKFLTEVVYCMKNGWTVTRCHLACMTRCNAEISQKLDRYIAHPGQCALMI